MTCIIVMHFSCMRICVWIVFKSKVEKNLKMIAVLKSVEGQASCTDERYLLLDPKKALDYYHKALEMKRKCLPDSCPYITPGILRDMALIYGYHSTEALEYLLEALDISVKGELVKPSNLARLLDDIAYTYNQMNRLEDSLQFYERALEIRQENLTNDPFNLTHSFRHIASLHESL